LEDFVLSRFYITKRYFTYFIMLGGRVRPIRPVVPPRRGRYLV